ncbi:MAG TPA: helix-hairpin-helix domain-containing protein, partial [Anaerolineales bacterium]|nr:helix-hairpin-helix domain-containing protein [Anaerolineales bacterium]
MSQNEYPLIDINTANEETLTQLTGVGPQLAKRIAEARPFFSVDDLTRVRGIGDRDPQLGPGHRGEAPQRAPVGAAHRGAAGEA